MTQVQLETDLAEWFLQATFIIAIAFAFLYGILFNWRETITGRSIMFLDLAIVGALLRSNLLLWGVDVVSINKHAGKVQFRDFDQALSWISICGVGIAGLSILALMYQCIRFKAAEHAVTNRYINRILFLGNHTSKQA